MIDPAAVADSIDQREIETLLIADRYHGPIAMLEKRADLKLRLIKELNQAANEAVHDLLTAASGAHELLSRLSFDNRADFAEAHIRLADLEQAIEQTKVRMKCP